MKILIIDDESKARSLLRNIVYQISRHEFELFEAENLAEGVALINQHQPSLVFLDIEMPDEQGTEILNYFEPNEINFELVFTTAYSEYALTAFEMNAIDYILKPIRPKRVLEVIEKVKTNFNQREIQEKLAELNSSLKNKTFQKLGVPVQDGIYFIHLKDIIRLEADGMYSKIFSVNKEPLFISKPLKFFSYLVKSDNLFFRPHRSHIVNIQYLKQYVRRDGNYILLDNDDLVPISKEKKDEFLNLIANLS